MTSVDDECKSSGASGEGSLCMCEPEEGPDTVDTSGRKAKKNFVQKRLSANLSKRSLLDECRAPFHEGWCCPFSEG